MKKLYLLLVGLFLLASCSKDDPSGGDTDAPLEACFEINKDTVSVGENLQITSCSKGVATYSYDFGNGETSEQENPIAIYQDGGEFDITLTVTNDKQETKNFSVSVFVESVESKYIFPDIAAGFTAFPLETGIDPNTGNLYSIELLEDNVGGGGAKYYYRELDENFTATSNYIADKPYNCNSAFVNIYDSGVKNFHFSRTLAGLYGTQEISYNGSWGFLNGINSATSHSYGYLPDGATFLYFGTKQDGGVYKTFIERRNATNDAFEEFINGIGDADSMIGDMIKTTNGYVAFGATFTKNPMAPQITGYKPILVFFDTSLAITGHVVFEDSVLDMKITSANDLNGSYHMAQLSNGNIAMYGNGELIVADGLGTKISSTYFEGTKNNQTMISFGNSFIISTDKYLRKFDSGGAEIKKLKYNGNYLPEILEKDNNLFFVAGFDSEVEVKLFYAAMDENLNLIDLNE